MSFPERGTAPTDDLQGAAETVSPRAAAGLADVTFHALRHTFASILIAQGHDVQFVARQLGHTKTSTTWDTYVHLFEAERHAQDARERLEADYGALLGGTTDT